MEIYTYTPSVMPAACTQVLDIPAMATSAALLALRGDRSVVVSGSGVGAAAIRTERVQVQGRTLRAHLITDGFPVQGNPAVVKAVGAASGVPPRGRPV